MNLCRCRALRAFHPRVTPPSRAAEKYRFLDSQCLQCRGQFTDAVATQLVGVIDRQMCPALADHLTLLAEGAGDDLDQRATSDVIRDGRTGREGLVVRMGVHEQQPGGLHSHQLACSLA